MRPSAGATMIRINGDAVGNALRHAVAHEPDADEADPFFHATSHPRAPPSLCSFVSFVVNQFTTKDTKGARRSGAALNVPSRSYKVRREGRLLSSPRKPNGLRS